MLFRSLAKYKGKVGYYPNYTFEDRPNLYGVYKGDGDGRSLLLSGHIDVVARGVGWTVDPFGGCRKDGRVYGRGAVDMKGGIACMTVAFKAIQECHIQLKGDVQIGTVVGEEAGGTINPGSVLATVVLLYSALRSICRKVMFAR